MADGKVSKRQTATAILLIAMLAVLMCGCRSSAPVVVEHTRMDSVVQRMYQRDSVYFRDSVLLMERNDTVFLTKTRYRYIERTVHDTLLDCRVDSIPYPVEVAKEVERKLTPWQRIRLSIANMTIVCLVIYLAFKVRNISF